MKKQSPSIAASIGKGDLEQLSQFRYRLRQFLRVSELICKESRITPLQYQLLLHVMGNPGRSWASISELAERLQAHHHGVVTLVNRCEAIGLCERRAGRDDQRVVEIHLLPKGKQLLEKVAMRHLGEVQSLIKELSPRQM